VKKGVRLKDKFLPIVKTEHGYPKRDMIEVDMEGKENGCFYCH
jgi:hypothetical protein